MNLEFLKSKKFILIVAIILIIIMISVIILMTNKDNEKLVLSCEKTVDLGETQIILNNYLYTTSDGYKLIKTIIIDSESMNFSNDTINNIAQDEIKENFGENYQFIKFDINNLNDKLSLKTTYIINSKNTNEMSDFLKIPFSIATVDDVKTIFEGDDLICQKY